MRVLGIETSCDETGLAIVDSETGLIGHVLYSQIALHEVYGGVVPELASRDHIKKITLLLEQLFIQTGLTKADLDGVVYTRGPGLVGALMTGALFGRALAMGLGIPALGVHHLEGHLLSPLMKVDGQAPLIRTPFVALLVSGGHTQLVAVRALGDYELIGESIDDAAGECFDKCAKMLGLPYPGGPQVAKLAQSGNPKAYDLPRPLLHKGADFSFSGLKSAVRRVVEAEGADKLNHADLCASLQAAIVEVLVKKSLKALKAADLQTLVIAGGVSANTELRAQLEAALAQIGGQVFYAPTEFCTDNGAMIAHAGLLRLMAGQSDGLGISTTPRWPLSELEPIESALG